LNLSGKNHRARAEPKPAFPAGQKVSIVREALQSKTCRASLFLLVLGFTFLFLENTFYQYLDKDGVLHESFFLPLGCLSLIAGGLGLLITVIKIGWRHFKLDTSGGTL